MAPPPFSSLPPCLPPRLPPRLPPCGCDVTNPYLYVLHNSIASLSDGWNTFLSDFVCVVMIMIIISWWPRWLRDGLTGFFIGVAPFSTGRHRGALGPSERESTAL